VKKYIVYCFDYKTKKKVRIGILIERRHEERGNNSEGILYRARQLYGGNSPILKRYITVSPAL
jgi:hypothetical protein